MCRLMARIKVGDTASRIVARPSCPCDPHWQVSGPPSASAHPPGIDRPVGRDGQGVLVPTGNGMGKRCRAGWNLHWLWTWSRVANAKLKVEIRRSKSATYLTAGVDTPGV